MAIIESSHLPMGMTIADFKLSATDGKIYSLDDFKDKKILIVIFMSNYCPYITIMIHHLATIQSHYAEKGVQIIGINSNDKEFSEQESLDGMKEIAKKGNINFIYLRDESQKIARELQAQCTPDIFVFDQERKLVYHGRLGNNWQESDYIKKQDLCIALDAILTNRPVPQVQHPSIGCSIKWKNTKKDKANKS